jgi:RHS repeat-associated protein
MTGYPQKLKWVGVLCFFAVFLELCPVLLHGQTIAPPSMTYQCTPDPLYVGAAAICTAHVGGGATGTVAFYLGSNGLGTISLDSNGDAAASTALFNPPPGVYTVTASYLGDSHYSPMQVQEGLTVYTGKVIVTSSTLTCSPYVIVAGNPVSCTANIPGGATGTVAFSVAGVPWATAPLDVNGNATVTGGLVSEPQGAYAIQATYSGDSNFSGFTTSTTMTVFSSQVQPYSQAQPYSMTVGCSPAALTVGQNGLCVIHVLGGATGTVDLYVHDQYFGTVTLDANGNATSTNMFSALTAGTYAVNAIYSGDANFATASAGTTVNIVNHPGTPIVSLLCSPAAISPGSGTNCTAQVSPGATGEILFYVSGNPWATVTLDSNSTAVATSGLSNLPAGTYSVVAYYPGDANFATGSAGTTIPISVTQPQPQMTLNCTPTALVVGNVANCTSTVSGGATGAVLLQVSGQITGGLGLNSSGSVTFGDQFQGVPAGNYTLQALYQGDSNFAPASAVTTVSVGSTQATPPFSVSVSPTTIQNGGSVNFVGQVGGGATGNVVISGNGIYIATLPLNQSGYINATSIVNVPWDGAYDIGFAYSGDANFLPTTQTAPLTVSANPPPPPPPPTSGYTFSITDSSGNSGYALNGNILNYTDSVNGTWNLVYDNLNRVTSATQDPNSPAPQYFCWAYDSFGNRSIQGESNATFSSLANCAPQSSASFQQAMANYIPNGSNQISSAVISEPNLNLSANYAYDLAGNVTDDGNSGYLYDGDNRLCAVNHYIIGTMTQYIYDADGTRVGKGTITTFSCDLTSNGFLLMNEYIPGPSGEQMTELDGQGNWIHTNAYAGEQLVATYDNDGKGVHFNIPDWLGTRRVQTDYTGTTESTCTNNPFGDPDTICASATEQFFTGKERDSESGLDYFGARYYGSSIGRWMSPDWEAKPEAVPYSSLDNPQSLNLYAYVGNNPMSRIDPDGHATQGQVVTNGIGVSFCVGGPCQVSSAIFLGSAQQQVGQDPTLPTAVAPSSNAVDTFMNAIFPKTWGDMASLALGVSTDGLGELAPALARAMELSNAMGDTAKWVTIGVTETKEGTTVVSSSEKALRPAVKALLKNGEVAAKGAGHAEVTGVNAAKQMGLTPTGVAASRGICPSCADYIRGAGAAILSTLRQW